MTSQTIAALRAETLAEFMRAQTHGSNDWRGIAERLAALLPSETAKTAKSRSAKVDLSTWADYAGPSWRIPHHVRHQVDVTFADGEAVRVGTISDTRKPINWGCARRTAIDFYKGRMTARAYAVKPHAFASPYYESFAAFERRIAVPAIVEMRCGQARAHLPMELQCQSE